MTDKNETDNKDFELQPTTETATTKTPITETPITKTSTTEAPDTIQLGAAEQDVEPISEPYKVLGMEIDEWSTVILDETLIPISVQYHPITNRLNLMVIQDYVSWATYNKEEFEKEHKQRKALGKELNLAVASELEVESPDSELSDSKSSESEISESKSSESETPETSSSKPKPQNNQEQDNTTKAEDK